MNPTRPPMIFSCSRTSGHRRWRVVLLAMAFLGAGMARAEEASGSDAPASCVRLGLQSWTCRRMTFEQVVEFALRHDIRFLQLFPKHISPDAPREEILRKKALLERNGLVCYAFGVARTSTDREQDRRLFEFARLMGLKLLIVAPDDLDSWDVLEELATEYDMRLAIHNEGPGTTYSDPAVVKRILAKRDRRIGVCLDVGHVTESGHDAAQVFREYGDRVFDIHLKDKRRVRSAAGCSVVDVDIGAGDVNFAGLFREIRRSHWCGVMAIETDSRDVAADPDPFVTHAAAFFRKGTSD